MSFHSEASSGNKVSETTIYRLKTRLMEKCVHVVALIILQVKITQPLSLQDVVII